MSAGLPQRRLKPQELTEEDPMIQHPSITAALADQRRAAFMAEAETARLAREARAARKGSDRSARRPLRLLTPRRLFRIPATRSRLARLRPARAR